MFIDGEFGSDDGDGPSDDGAQQAILQSFRAGLDAATDDFLATLDSGYTEIATIVRQTWEHLLTDPEHAYALTVALLEALAALHEEVACARSRKSGT